MAQVDPLRDLLEMASEGDDVALAELVRRTQRDVHSLCCSLGSPDEAEDLTQETYLRMMKAVTGFRGDSSVRTWLLSIARFTCADYVRARQRQRRLTDRLVESAERFDQIDPGDPEELLVRLDPLRREAFVLTQMVGLSYQEAAEVIECPVGTVRSRVSRAREDLLAELRRQEQIA